MRISDFQKPATPQDFAVDPNVMVRNAKAAASRTDWRKTRITEQQGAVESDPLRSLAMDSQTDSRRERLHAALDRLLSDSSDDDEPEEEDDDEETPESFKAAMDSLQRRLRAILHASDSDSGAAVIVSPARHKVTHTAGYVNDAAFIAGIGPEPTLRRRGVRTARPITGAAEGTTPIAVIGQAYFSSSSRNRKVHAFGTSKTKRVCRCFCNTPLGGMTTAFGA